MPWPTHGQSLSSNTVLADKRILRLIAKWLKVGITEDGRVTRRDEVEARRKGR